MHSISHVLWGFSKHAAFAYVVFSLVQHGRGRSPTGRAVAAVLVGAALPDLVDKSLVAVGLVGYGRSFAHSLVVTAAFVVLVVSLSRRWSHTELGDALCIGYVSHAPVDLYGPLLTGKSMDTAFLFWPFIVEYPVVTPPPTVGVSRSVLFTAVVLSALTLWVYDGMPVAAEVVRSFHQTGSRG